MGSSVLAPDAGPRASVSQDPSNVRMGVKLSKGRHKSQSSSSPRVQLLSQFTLQQAQTRIRFHLAGGFPSL